MEHLDADSLEMASFTGELVALKLQEIDALEHCTQALSQVGSDFFRRTTTLAYREPLDELCLELGELAGSIPGDQVIAERALVAAPSLASRMAGASLTEYGDKLAVLLPFIADKIGEQVAEICTAITIKHESVLDDTSQARLETLTALESVLATPIRWSAASNRLLEYFATHETADDQEQAIRATQHNQPLPMRELLRQMTKTTPRGRLLEYCHSFAMYPIEVTALADVVYLNDSRDTAKKHATMTAATNPKQTAGKAVYQMLLDRGLVLQRGWISKPDTDPTKPATKKRVVRSLLAKNYTVAEHVGEATDGTNEYVWEPVGEIVSDAQGGN